MSLFEWVMAGMLAVGIASLVILAPLEYSLRRSHLSFLPRFGLTIKREFIASTFQSLEKVVFEAPELYPVSVNKGCFLISQSLVRGTIVPDDEGGGCVITFRFPIGFILFATLIPIAFPIGLAPRALVNPLGFLVAATAMVALSTLFLSVFRGTANHEITGMLRRINFGVNQVGSE